MLALKADILVINQHERLIDGLWLDGSIKRKMEKYLSNFRKNTELEVGYFIFGTTHYDQLADDQYFDALSLVIDSLIQS